MAGYRLTNPAYSPPNISHLLQTCWLADPSERPTFTMIKETLRNVCPFLNPDVKQDSNNYLTLLSDNSGQTQYKMIQECNPLYQKEKSRITESERHSKAAPANPYSYLEGKPGVATTGSTLNSTSNEEGVEQSYIVTTVGIEEAEQIQAQAPLLNQIPDDQDDDVFSDQVLVDRYKYLRTFRRLSMSSI